jgi:hypothetical protein
MFWCDNCNVQRLFDHTDYYGFDIYVCPKCSSQIEFPADGYGEPDDDIDDEEYFGEPGEDDDFLWFEPDEEEMDDLLDDGVYEGDVVIHQPYDDEENE